MEPTINEIAPDLYRICTFIEPHALQVSQFLVKDEVMKQTMGGNDAQK